MIKSREYVLGIDFGRRNIGLAISEGYLAEPLQTINYSHPKEALAKIKKIIDRNKFDKIVVGVSENEMATITREFANKLGKITKLPIVFWDETLTSVEAGEKILRKKKTIKERKIARHQFAAGLILQDYLDQW